MNRRNFLSSSGLTAIAISTTGFIRHNGVRFVGDCETTSDLLGPFYRPMSPVRNNLVIEDSSEPIVKINGVIRHDDCITPYKGAKIELWHVDQNGKYDNTSDDFKYRGTSYSDENGAYEFTTQIPVPYPDVEGNYRPAHFHFLISAGDYQSLITQIYLGGDPHLTKDAASASEQAAKRILPVTEKFGQKEIEFNIVMAKKLKITVAGLDKIVGNYKGINHDKQIDCFSRDGQLWTNWNKTSPYGEPYEYKGNNHFEYVGWPESGHYTLDFIFQEDGKIKLRENYYWNAEDNSILEYMKEK